MTISTTLRTGGLVGALVAMTISPSAHAVVATWGYDISSSFTAATYSDGGVFAGSTSSLSWGAGGSGPSSLVVGNSPVSGSVDTYLGGGAPPVVAPYLGFSTSLTHNNNPINGASLVTATLTNSVVLHDLSNLPHSLPQIVPFSIQFAETPNSAPCAVGASPTPCNDIFVLTSGLLNFSFMYDDDGVGGADTYFVNIFPVTGGVLGILDPGVCAAANAGAGCIGFTTPEGQSTSLRFGFTISSQPLSVPEPGLLALLGIGLLGAAGSRCRSLNRN
jgi:hypothetical protein